MIQKSKMKLAAFLVGLIGLVFTTTSSANFAWYYGHIDRIYLFKSGFVVTMDSSALSDCMHNYVYFRDNLLGETAVNRAYSMVLSGQSTGRLIGVVIDKAINGPSGLCFSNGSVDIKD